MVRPGSGVLEGLALEPGLEWVASTFRSHPAVGGEGIHPAHLRLVAAVRSYTQMDRASMQRIDVTDGLDSTLVMLGHKLRGRDRGREYGTDVPLIDAYAGELNQVWTNLSTMRSTRWAVGHAASLDAGRGREVVIEIADTGPGIRRR